MDTDSDRCPWLSLRTRFSDDECSRLFSISRLRKEAGQSEQNLTEQELRQLRRTALQAIYNEVKDSDAESIDYPPIEKRAALSASANLIGAMERHEEQDGAVLDAKHERALLEAVIDCLSVIQWWGPADLPEEAAYYLKQRLSYVVAGRMPPEWKSLVFRHAPKATKAEKGWVGWGVVYVKASRVNHISDPHPTKTVSKHFGVARTTVQTWCRLPEFAKISPLPPFMAANPEQDHPLEMSIVVPWIKRRMEEAGEQYRLCGTSRSHAAIGRRRRLRVP